MAEYLFIASVCALVLPVLSAWHRDRVKDGHNPRVRRAIRIWAVCSVLVIGLSGSNVYISHKQSADLRAAEQALTVIRSLSKYRIELFESYFLLWRSAATVREYAMYEAGRLSSGHPDLLPSWESRVSSERRTELVNAKFAFERTQHIAREVLIQCATYPALVPKSLETWSNVILAAKFEQVTELIDPYHEGPRSIQYAKLFGEAIGAVTGAEMQTSAKLIQ